MLELELGLEAGLVLDVEIVMAWSDECVALMNWWGSRDISWDEWGVNFEVDGG